MSESKMNESEMSDFLAICDGVRADKGSLRYQYRFMPADGRTTVELTGAEIEQHTAYLLKKKIGGSAEPGSVYIVKARYNEKGLVYRTTGAVYAGAIADREYVAGCAVAHKVARLEAEAEAAAKKYDALLETLGPIRDAYRTAWGANRARVIAAVVEYITR